MKTNLDVGAAVVVRAGGKFVLHEICEVAVVGRAGLFQKALTTVQHALQTGDPVWRVVWKDDDTLEAREAYVLRHGDAVWLDTGFHPFDLTKPPTVGYQVDKTRTIHVNRFERGPMWLRKAE